MELVTVDRIEAAWTRALDSASEAVTFCADAKLLSRTYVQHKVAHIHAERTWLEGARPALRELFPPAHSAMMSRH